MNHKEMLFYRERSETLKALANPYRLWMVEKLAKGEQVTVARAKLVDEIQMI